VVITHPRNGVSLSCSSTQGKGNSVLTNLIQQHDSGYNKQIPPKNAPVVLHPTAMRCPQHPFTRFTSTKDHWEAAATGRATQLMAVLDLLLLQEQKPRYKDAMFPSGPWTLCSQVTTTEPKEQEEISNKHFALPSPPALTSKTNTKEIQATQILYFYAVFSWPSLWQRKNCEQIPEHSDMEFLHCCQCKEAQQLWWSPKHASRYITQDHPLLLHQLF